CIGIALIDMKQLHALVKHSDLVKGAPGKGTLQSLREGLAYVARTPSILLIIAVVGVVSLFGINFNVVLPLFATDVLNVGPQGFGFLSSALGFGALVSALWIAWGNKKPRIKQMLWGATFFCVLEAFFALSPWYPISLLLI